MAWKLKKEWNGYQDRRFNKNLEDLTQKEINKLNDGLKNLWFEQDKPKKKKDGLDE
tara:strand:+ start:321 stop:488 length:168 start_codon:yes stop_codon:yes gene_type:complete